MIAYLPYPRTPLAPRRTPRPVPAVEVDAEPVFCLRVNGEWLSHLLGMMSVLAEVDAWAEADRERGIQGIERLLASLHPCTTTANDDYLSDGFAGLLDGEIANDWTPDARPLPAALELSGGQRLALTTSRALIGLTLVGGAGGGSLTVRVGGEPLPAVAVADGEVVELLVATGARPDGPLTVELEVAA